MRNEQDFQDHWVNIDPERMKRYETMYRWNPATEVFYAPAKIGPGQVIADFGCGPGHAAIEFANRVGPSGHVHALDINPSSFGAQQREPKTTISATGSRLISLPMSNYRSRMRASTGS